MGAEITFSSEIRIVIS